MLQTDAAAGLATFRALLDVGQQRISRVTTVVSAARVFVVYSPHALYRSLLEEPERDTPQAASTRASAAALRLSSSIGKHCVLLRTGKAPIIVPSNYIGAWDACQGVKFQEKGLNNNEAMVCSFPGARISAPIGCGDGDSPFH
jgi:hypothetical protein